MTAPKKGKEEWHGTPGGYANHGCRCAKCRAAHAANVRRYRANQVKKGRCVNCSALATRGRRCGKHADARLAYSRVSRQK